MLLFGFSATPGENEHYFSNPISYLSVYDAVQQKVLVPWKNMSLGAWEKNDDQKWYALQMRGRALRPDKDNLNKVALFIAPQDMFSNFDLAEPNADENAPIPLLITPSVTHVNTHTSGATMSNQDQNVSIDTNAKNMDWSQYLWDR